MTLNERKHNLLVQSQVIGKLLYNQDLSVTEATKALSRIVEKLNDIESQEDYSNSISDYLDETEAFLYKGKV